MDPRLETIQPDANSAFRGVCFECETLAQDHPWHYHPEFELTWVVTGAGTRFVGDSAQPYRPGDLVLVGPNLPHCWHNDPHPTERPRLVVVQFRADGFGPGFFDLPEFNHVRTLLARASRAMAFDPPTARRVGARLRALVDQSGVARLARLLEVLDLLSLAPAVPLASESYDAARAVTLTNRRKLDAVQDYVREGLGEEIRQAEIAQRLGMSSSAFSRFFKLATGETFVGFVNILRVNAACRLLGGTDRAVIDIAMECGYQNISNFNRQFRALKGMNPSEYRQHLRRLSDHDAAWRRQGGGPQASRFAGYSEAAARG